MSQIQIQKNFIVETQTLSEPAYWSLIRSLKSSSQQLRKGHKRGLGLTKKSAQIQTPGFVGVWKNSAGQKGYKEIAPLLAKYVHLIQVFEEFHVNRSR